MTHVLQPKKVNYKSNGKRLEVEFYRDQQYVGRVTFDNALQRDEPMEVNFYWTEKFRDEERDRLTEEAFTFGTADQDHLRARGTMHWPNTRVMTGIYNSMYSGQRRKPQGSIQRDSVCTGLDI
jgi:hypothetical protein